MHKVRIWSVKTYGYWTLDVLDVAFFLQDLLCPVAQTFDICIFDIVALLEVLDPSIEIVISWAGCLLGH